MTRIIVNAQAFDFAYSKISYDEIVSLARNQKQGLQTIVISYHGTDKKGRTVTKGESADVIEGMIIDCLRTDNA